MSRYASVILDLSIEKRLDYEVPESFLEKARPGVRVEVPVRGRLQTGYIFEVKDQPDFAKPKPIHRLLSEEALIPADLFQLALWMARYYATPIHKVLKCMVPSSLRRETKEKQQRYVMRLKTREELQKICRDLREKHSAQAEVLDAMLLVKKGILLTELLEKTGGSRSPVDTLVKKGLLKMDIVRIDRSPLVNEEYLKTRPKQLNSEQQAALERICRSLEAGRFGTHLVHGITGSGKTEIYLQAIDRALSLGKGVIMLVPEISLTAQTIQRFRSRFEGNIAILHHRLSHGERFDEWERIQKGKAKIVIGARSAVFSPVPDLGLLIVDEEHEATYKQTDEQPCYHARDVAVMRGSMNQASVILGSATPSLESYRNAKEGKYQLSVLKTRAEKSEMPEVTIVDMKREYQKAKGYTNFSDELLSRIKTRYERGEQTLLFLNRRGYHSMLMCRGCGEAVKCRHCDASLTFHRGDNVLSCHLCGFQHTPPPQKCPSCKSPKPMKFRGTGTELVEKSLHAIFPEIRSIRVDADTTRHKGSHQRLLRDFGAGKADVLIGTQMIAKGLHFPQVTLVGVLNSDATLNIPDFRSSETVFQLITQVAGRAGRGELPGEVVIQTCLPENGTIQLAARQDYEAFYSEEIAVRELFHYPPFSAMAKLLISGEKERQVEEAGQQLRAALLTRLPADFELYPVIPAGHAKVKDRFRYQFLIRGPSVQPICRALEALQPKRNLPKSLRLHIDINPLSTFF